MQWLKHAFAIDSPHEEPTPAQEEALEYLAQFVVRRHLSSPAVAFLEMARPLNYFGAQMLYFLAPFLSVLTLSAKPQHLAAFLERRDAIDRLCTRIEAMEAEYQAGS